MRCRREEISVPKDSGGSIAGGPDFLASSTAQHQTQLGSLREPLSESRYRAAERRFLPASPDPAQHTDGSLVTERQRGADGREASHHVFSQPVRRTSYVQEEAGIDTRSTVQMPSGRAPSLSRSRCHGHVHSKCWS